MVFIEISSSSSDHSLQKNRSPKTMKDSDSDLMGDSGSRLYI